MSIELKIGLLTDGKPSLHIGNGCFTLDNLLIGKGFHWQRRVSAIFAGKAELLDTPDGDGIQLVNKIDAEEYLKSVTGSEMSPDAPIEFLKAHAVISRSWALRKKYHKSSAAESPYSTSFPSTYRFITWEESTDHTLFDLCSDDHCQRYQGIPSEGSNRAAEAVEATRGIVLADKQGMIADARFSKCCGGRTEVFESCWTDCHFDYLTSIDDHWCDLNDMTSEERTRFLGSVLKNYDTATSDFHDWQVNVRPDELRRRIVSSGYPDIGEIIKLSALSRGTSGRITELKISGASGSLIIGKTLAIRRLLAADCLKSSWFDINTESDGSFSLRGHGWGHGVGLCQIGAAHMAAAGHDWREILNFYYPHTTLEQLYD